MRFKMLLKLILVLVIHGTLGYFDLERARASDTNPDGPAGTDEMRLYPDYINWRQHFGFVNNDEHIGMNIRRNTVEGRIYGFSVPAHYDRHTFVNVFLGIPYAQAPIRHLRFERPRPLPMRDRINDLYDATFYRPACPQPYEYMNSTIPGFDYTNEDCLYLNIFEPHRTRQTDGEPNRRYPVMVYIHGGMFKSGSAINYPGLVLAQRDMVVVTIQYRLGPLGFITIDQRSPCNLGLLDQKAALEWVKANIYNFFGDPNKITIFGHEAGAASVGLQMISPQNRKQPGHEIFHKAIMMSGSDLSQWAVIPQYALLYTHELARRVGCRGYIGLEDNLLTCLRQVHADDLALASVDLMRGDTAGPFAPIMDDFAVSSFINAMPRDIRTFDAYQSQVQDIPILAGFNKDEGADILKKNFSHVFSDIDYGVTTSEFLRVASNASLRRNARDPSLVTDAIQFQYTYWSNPDNDTARRKMLIDLFTDEYYASGVDEVLKLHAKKTEKKIVNRRLAPDSSFQTYMYKFDYRSEQEDRDSYWMGADHESILRYLFGWPYMNTTYQKIVGLRVSPLYSELDRNVSNATMQLFKEFAFVGHPIPNQNNLLPWNFQNLTWHPFKTNNVTYFEINYNSTNRKEYHQSQLAFWRTYIYDILRIAPFTTTPFFTTNYPFEGFQAATYALSGTVVILIIVIIALALVIVTARRGSPSINKSAYY